VQGALGAKRQPESAGTRFNILKSYLYETLYALYRKYTMEPKVVNSRVWQDPDKSFRIISIRAQPSTADASKVLLSIFVDGFHASTQPPIYITGNANGNTYASADAGVCVCVRERERERERERDRQREREREKESYIRNFPERGGPGRRPCTDSASPYGEGRGLYYIT
jgi:hypothetical protein